MIDVIIIGAGVVGANIARELSRYDLSIAVIETHEDVCEETSKANSGIVHSGYDAKPGTLKAKYNVLGNQMMEALCLKLNVPFKRNGSLVLAFDEAGATHLNELWVQGQKNGVQGLKIIDRDEILRREPRLNPEVLCALDAPMGGIVDPFQLTISSAEVASRNGVLFHFGQHVVELEKIADGFRVITKSQVFESRIVINCAGVYGDELNNRISKHHYHIKPRKGEYLLFDKQVGHHVRHTIFQLPGVHGKGVLVTPTAEGNLLIGPNSVFVDRKDDTATTPDGIRAVIDTARISMPEIPLPFLITGFAGLRASESSGDFIIQEAEDVAGFYNVIGIESPGLTATPAIAQDVAMWVARALHAKEKTNYQSERADIVRFIEQDTKRQKALFAENHDYGRIVCRCESITLAEIKDAIHRELGARTVDGIKRRTRAGSGRCQGGFCTPKIMEVLAQELHLTPNEIKKFSPQSTYLVGLDKDLL